MTLSLDLSVNQILQFMEQAKFSQNSYLILESGHRVLIDRLLSQQNFKLLVDGLDSQDIQFKIKCINALLEAAKIEINPGILATQEIIKKLVDCLVDLCDYPSSESQSLRALFLLNIDGIL
jgi:hypothetical protein